MELINKKWKEFKIGDFFTISTGSLVPKEILRKGTIARLTATDNNNGIFDFYEKVEHKNYREISNFISVSFLGSVFYHPYSASLDMKIHAVQVPNIELNRYIAEFLVFCFKRMASSFSYGDQLSSTDLPKKKILLPANSKGEPDYPFMENYMRQKEMELLKQYEKQLSEFENTIPLSEKEWKEFKTTDIFNNIQRGKRLKKDDHKSGVMPYVSSTAINNGVDGFVGNKENVRTFSNCLTLANSGSVGATFYQPFSFVASDHVTKLENDNFNKYIYLFIANLTSRFSEKYSFNREINDTRIKKEKILLPTNSKSEPDYAYMENYMKALECEKIKQYLEYRKRKTGN
jgi:hypothetical protein